MAGKAIAQSPEPEGLDESVLDEPRKKVLQTSTDDRSSGNSEAPSPTLPRGSDSFWISASRGFLFAVMLSYFSVIALVVIGLAGLAYYLSLFYSGLNGQSLWIVGTQTLLAAGLVLTTRSLLSDLRGLFTSRHDSPPEPETNVFLPPDRYDQVYAMVADVAADVEAPRPTQVHVSPLAECYMIEDRSRRSSTPRRVLVLGFPHLLVFSIDQLKVIIGHELVHLRYGDVTTGLYMHRFLESLRLAVLRRHASAWRLINPLYGLSKLYLSLLLLLSAPIQRRQELRADRHSAQVYGGELAAQTLLRDWLLTSQFEANSNQYRARVDSGEVSPRLGPYRWFLERWQEISLDGCEYLSSRLAQEEESDPLDSHPTIQVRLDTMHAFPSGDQAPGQPAHRLIHDLARLEKQCSEAINRP